MIPNFKPLNPWGRPMPKIQGPSGSTELNIEPLYQVHVELRDGKAIPVGPKMVKHMAEEFLMAINTKIVQGKEKEWANPTLLPVRSKLT